MAKNGGAGGRPKGDPPKRTRRASALFDDVKEQIDDAFEPEPEGFADFTDDPALGPLRAAIVRIDLIIDSHISVDLLKKLMEVKDDIYRYMEEQEKGGGDGDIAETIRAVLVRNASKINGWLTKIGEKEPLKALTLYKDLAEYIIPKIQRTGGGGVNEPQIVINFESTEGHKKRLANKPKEEQ